MVGHKSWLSRGRGRRTAAHLALAAVVLAGCDCGSSTAGTGDGGGADGAPVRGGSSGDGTTRDSAPPSPTFHTELWYSVDDLLVRIEIDADSGAVVAFQESLITVALEPGQNAITMLEDGSLLGSRLSRNDDRTHFYLVADPPRDGSAVTPELLGVMPDDLMIEGLYSDCEGRIYAMDTGEDDTSSAGNRLLRFTGNVLAGDFSYAVISDLSAAVVADIDDMGPGIAGNTITDNPGFAIDTGNIYDFNYETGTGVQVGNGGTFGIHALGGDLFTDGRARLFVLSNDAVLFEVDPTTYTLSASLGTGPTPDDGPAGWSSLAGPLTECETGFLI